MRRLRVCEGAPRNLSYPYVDGSLRPGDEFDVADDKAAALLDAHDYLREADIVLSEDDYEVVADDGDDADSDDGDDLSALTKAELYDMAAEADIDGRSDMTKAELRAALEED